MLIKVNVLLLSQTTIPSKLIFNDNNKH